jgi:hypothetical protein
MKKYIVTLKMGGLMEDPEWHEEYQEEIFADNERDAKDKWAEKTGHKDKSWDNENQTYWGWSVIVREIKQIGNKKFVEID